jgi:hypothetical protein
MRAFEPDELKRVSIAKVSRAKVPVQELRRDNHRGSARGWASVATSIGLICLIILVLAVIAGVRP